MVAFFRQFLVVLLVFLQNAAPLMHAHTGQEGTQSGLHLYEFETLRLIVDHSSVGTANFAQDTENFIVSVGSAIKHTDSNLPAKLFLDLSNKESALAPLIPADLLKFSLLNAVFSYHLHPNPNQPRAPPF
jgi:hypothetical protein